MNGRGRIRIVSRGAWLAVVATVCIAPAGFAGGIVNGVMSATGRLSPQDQQPAATQPALALSTLINFDDSPAPCGFLSTGPLRSAYAAQGVTFSGPGALNGGAILDQCGNFSVFGYSAPNFVGFNSLPQAVMNNGGFPVWPERMTFSSDVSAVQVAVGGGSGGFATLNAYNSANALIGSDGVSFGSVMRLLHIAQPGIRYVELDVTNGSAWVFDDLSFDLPTCRSDNVAPHFDGATPCGSSLQLLAGTPIHFDVQASDPDSTDTVSLNATIPAGAGFVANFGNPASGAFDWTPTAADTGDHAVTFVASDGCDSSTCSIAIHVFDNRPPDCSNAVASEPQLWPPNHTYHAISILGVSDPDGDPVSVTVTRVTQDEPVNGRGDGNTCPDALILGGQASVRAERAGTSGVPGNGRVYAVNFTASDGRGGTCDRTVFVCVPHDQDSRSTCTDDGQRYDSTGPCGSSNSLGAEAVTSASLKVGEVTATQAQVEFALPADARVQVAVFDVAGRRLATLENGPLAAGVHQRVWDMNGATRGLYFVRLKAGAETLTRTVVKTR